VSHYEFTLRPRGPFSLAEATSFGFGQWFDPTFDGVMRLAFCADGLKGQVGVEVRQEGDEVRCLAQGSADRPVVQAQVARVLSLDCDADEFLDVAGRDPVIAQLQKAAPGLRPPLFYSPYEAAAWAVMSARRPPKQMAEVRRRLSVAHGTTFELAGQEMPALPTPKQLLEVAAFPGIPEVKIERLHAVAEAAIEGKLDVGRLRRMDPAAATTELQEIKGIGPFYSALIVIRSVGFTDVLPSNEPKVLELAGRLYDLDGPPSQTEFEARAEAWKPWRTWAVVLMRAAGQRVLDAR